jgi:hypothetical protein
MSLPRKHNTRNPAPIELRRLARLELKKRHLLRELEEVLEQHQELSQEIESKRIPIPWRPIDLSRNTFRTFTTHDQCGYRFLCSHCIA